MKPAYKRVLLKLSGEDLAGGTGYGINPATVESIARSIVKCHAMGVEIGIVVGGGNLWRGASHSDMDRTRADHIGMLATMMNSLAVADAIEKLGKAEVRVQSAVAMNKIAEPCIRSRAMRHLEKGRVVIFGAGTGNPFFSTDTAAALRAAEINAEVVLKATHVDGVYDKDPKKYADAKKYDTLSFAKVLSDHLTVVDMTAASLCEDNKIPLLVFNLDDPENICRAICGENIGTVVK